MTNPSNASLESILALVLLAFVLGFLCGSVGDKFATCLSPWVDGEKRMQNAQRTYEDGYRDGAETYGHLTSTITQAHVRCNSTGGPTFSDLIIEGPTFTIDSLRPLFVCPDNSDRML